jgi:hypothetical protein
MLLVGDRQPFWNDRGHLYCHYHNTKFHPNPPIGSKVIMVFLYIHLKFKRSPFWNGWSYEIKKCDVEVNFNGSTCLPSFTKIHRTVLKLLVGDSQTHRQTAWWFDKPISFFESRLKTATDCLCSVGRLFTLSQQAWHRHVLAGSLSLSCLYRWLWTGPLKVTVTIFSCRVVSCREVSISFIYTLTYSCTKKTCP